MKLLPLIGSLLISAVPARASQTFEELTKPCNASEEAQKACYATAMYATSFAHHDTICDYCEAGLLKI